MVVKAGSHMNLSWAELVNELDEYPPEENLCVAKELLTPPIGLTDAAWEGSPPAGTKCIFPFRYIDVGSFTLYYVTKP